MVHFNKSFGFVTIAALMHLLVDAICLCVLYLMSGTFYIGQALSVFLIYNILAFMSQPFTGIIADKIKKTHWILILSLLFLIFAVILLLFMKFNDFIQNEMWAYMIAALSGIGNSLFHVWGAKQTVLKTGNDLRSLGLFVSTGALGLAFAAVLFSWHFLFVLLLMFSLLTVGYIFYDNKENIFNYTDIFNADRNSRVSAYPVPLILIFCVAITVFVCFRSFMGEALTIDLNKNNVVILTLGLLATLGKLSGGWIAKSVGAAQTLIFAFLIVAVCFFMKSYGLIPVFTGVFVINTTMPITLYWINLCMKGREALAFGILAAALIPGYLIAHI